MIRIDGLVKRFGSFTAVDGVSFAVEAGEVLGFLGPNGAGKSTTMKMVTGYLTPTAGTASVCGHDVTRNPLAVKERLGYLPEGAPAYPDMTPEGFLRFIAAVRGVPRRDRKGLIASVADRVRLGGVMMQPIDTLSKGYKRRVGLAAAILHNPDVLIMDEPTDGLDPNQKHEVRTLITAMSRAKAIILSTHILEEVEAVCTRAIIVARGRIVADGTPASLRTRSRTYNAVTVRMRNVSASEARAALSNISGVAEVEGAGAGVGTSGANAGSAGAAVGTSGANVGTGGAGIGTSAAGDAVEFTCIPRRGSSILAEVHTMLRAKDWNADEVRLEPGRLDDVFREITTTPKEVRP
ncbi:MAG: ABC transporter ATP-binding protein [Phycisphaerales bacterium]|jgi:ABC-2 type transport system ATP-binding protein